MNLEQTSSVTFPIHSAMPGSAEEEHYAQIVDRLLAMDSSSRQVLVTSPNAGEGKSVTAMNLAYAFHARGIPVLLAELSFERPVFAEVFGSSPTPFGIRDVLAIDMPLNSVVCELMDGLKVALAGSASYPQPLLVPGPAFDRLVSEARANYEWTIFDAPPVASIPDVTALAKAVGIPLVVARARETSSHSLLKAIERIDRAETTVVLNDV
jgi:Mrp family chromosome partitioning ATPase